MTRRPLAALLAVMALGSLLVPPAGGQGTGPGDAGSTLALTDPAGDVRTEVNGVPAAGGELAYPAVDLLGLTVTEQSLAFHVVLSLAALPQPQDPGADGTRYDLYLTHNGREFLAVVQMSFPTLGERAFLTVAYRDGPGGWSVVYGGPDPVVDAAAKTISFDLPRGLLADADGAEPSPGRTLEAVHVVARSLFDDAAFSPQAPQATMPQHVTDLMPDDAAAWGALPVRLGLTQTGHARLASPQPFRATNGEATTFVYNVTASNLADRPDTFELEATGLPAGFSAVLPVPFLDLEAASDVQLPVLVTIPFSHDHGDVESFVLEMRSLSDAGSVGRLRLGVRYLEVPQPAGHHATVYLHNLGASDPVGFFGAGDRYINTLEDDPNDAGDPQYSSGFRGDGSNFTYEWVFGLQPALQIGLHVDPALTGRIAVPFGTTLPMGTSHMTASLVMAEDEFEFFVGGDRLHELARATSATFDLGPQGTHLFEADLVASDGEQRVPYTPGPNLFLAVRLHATVPTLGEGNEGPYVAPGGSATLPLREWHDPVDEVLASIGGPGLSPLGPQERLVNPGEAVVFPVSIANPLDDATRFDLEVSGPNAAWATLPGPVTVPAHGTATATIVVRAPAGAADGDRADLVLQAFPHDEPTARGLLRFVAEVDTDADQPDDSAIAPEAPGKDSPGAGAGLAAVAALAALALARRRSGRAGR